jgi:hypothetical protein
LTEARRVKEAVFFADTAEFELAPPEELRAFEARLRGEAPLPVLTRSELVTLLTDHGLYRTVTQLLEEVLTTLRGRGLGEDQLDDVLLVGGSTLLPGFYGLFEERFGRDRVRAWQPFEAVAYGATVFASERVVPNDFIVHDYALLVHDRKSQSAQHPIIIPRGTRFPTPSDFWKRQLVPTCSLGEPETLFKLVVCELGEGFSPQEDEARFVWDAEGRVHQVGGGTSVASAEPPRSRAPLVIPLNATHPTLGYLDPPHAPSDKRPRLEVSFGVNAERWLCATVLDLQTQRWLLKDEPVVRVL